MGNEERRRGRTRRRLACNVARAARARSWLGELAVETYYVSTFEVGGKHGYGRANVLLRLYHKLNFCAIGFLETGRAGRHDFVVGDYLVFC